MIRDELLAKLMIPRLCARIAELECEKFEVTGRTICLDGGGLDRPDLLGTAFVIQRSVTPNSYNPLTRQQMPKCLLKQYRMRVTR